MDGKPEVAQVPAFLFRYERQFRKDRFCASDDAVRDGNDCVSVLRDMPDGPDVQLEQHPNKIAKSTQSAWKERVVLQECLILLHRGMHLLVVVHGFLASFSRRLYERTCPVISTAASSVVLSQGANNLSPCACGPLSPRAPICAAPHTIVKKGGLLVAPILQVLLLNRDPGPVLDWADRVAKWPFRRVIPCHLANDVAATPAEFRKAFRFLEKGVDRGSKGGGLMSLFGRGEETRVAQPLPEDMQFLRDAEKTLVGLGTLFPAAEPIERPRR